jgi:hypothetical protein
MTAIQGKQLWNTMPGWGIVADLTPPELLNSRRLKVLRKVITAGLVAILVLCVGSYVLASRKHTAASGALADVQSRTVQLKAQERKFRGITKIEGTVAQIQAQVATLLSGDVDLSTLMVKIRTSLPATMTIKQESITISLAGVAPSSSKGSVGVDLSGHRQIGNIILSGAGQTLVDLSAFVDALKVLPGVINVIPTSNTADKTGMQYSLTLGLTDQLLSHRFDKSKNGSK